MAEQKLEARLKYGDLEATFSGNVNEVVKGIFKFLSDVYPAYETLSRITLTVNTEGLLRDLEGIVARTPEGMVLLVDTTRIPDKEAILLHLLRAYLAQQLSMGQRDSLPISEILRITGGKPGAIAGRLSELTSEGLVERVGKGEYRVTTLGIKWIVEKVLPKLKEGG